MKKPWVMAMGCGVAATLLFLSGMFVLITPLPLLYAGGKYGVRPFGLALLASLTLLTVLTLSSFVIWPGMDNASTLALSKLRYAGFGYFTYYLWISAVLVWGLKKKRPILIWGGHLLGTTTLLVLAVGALVSFVSEISILGVVRDYLGVLVQEVVKVRGQMEGSLLEADLMLQQSGDFIQFMIQTGPAWIFVLTTVVVVVNLWLGKSLLKLRSLRERQGEFLKFKLPFGLVWWGIAAGVAFFIDRYIVPLHAMQVVAVNSLIVLSVLYLIQGLSVLNFLARRVSLWFRWMIYLSLFLFLQFGIVVLACLGFIDSWTNFRKV